MSPFYSTSFHYDHVFGTVINRFICQSVIGEDLTVYGNGTQTRGYLNIIDTLNCVNIATNNPAKSGEFRVFNQYTEVLSINDIAKYITDAANKIGIKTNIKNLENPRIEQENHYYKPKNENLLNLGLQPTLINDNVLPEMIKKALINKDKILKTTILPTIKWKK